jgi:hypothetical protein
MGLAISVGVNNPDVNPSSSAAPQFRRPLQDEWGIFDPEQAGIEAVLRKLSAISNAKDAVSPPTSPAATE